MSVGIYTLYIPAAGKMFQSILLFNFSPSIFDDIVVFAILATIYFGGLIASLLKVGPYRRLDAKRRKMNMVGAVSGALFIIYFAIILLKNF